MNSYKGIDYGNGMTNVDHKASIRYGVISQHEVLQAWADSSEGVYPDEAEMTCPECGADCFGTVGSTVACECGEELEIELPDCCEVSGFEYVGKGYTAHCGEDGDIFITLAPYYTYAAFCSPCAPGACYLTTEVEPDDSNKAYCFGHDWFEDGKAPYTVYSVATGEIVQPKE
jgi:hypothetical protein